MGKNQNNNTALSLRGVISFALLQALSFYFGKKSNLSEIESVRQEGAEMLITS